jgi:hypothetical protein
MDASMRHTTRRTFLRDSAAALIVGGPALDALTRHTAPPPRESALKSAAQYRSEALQFESAFNEFTSVSSTSIPSTDIVKTVTRLDPSALAVNYQDSWMVAIAMADSGLVDWVKREIRDEATLKKFVDAVKRDPRSIYSVSAIASLSARLDTLKTQKRAVVAALIQQERKLAGLEATSAEAAAKAAEAQECAKIWSLVAAVLVAVIVAVIAIVVTVFSSQAVYTEALNLAKVYAGTGAELVRAKFSTADQRYAQCVAAAKALPVAQQPKALAACQAALLTEKIAYIG